MNGIEVLSNSNTTSSPIHLLAFNTCVVYNRGIRIPFGVLEHRIYGDKNVYYPVFWQKLNGPTTLQEFRFYPSGSRVTNVI